MLCPVVVGNVAPWRSALPVSDLLSMGYIQEPPVILASEPKGQGAVPDRKRKSIYDTVTDTEMVEKVFGFLPAMIGGQEGPAPTGFEVRQFKQGREDPSRANWDLSCALHWLKAWLMSSLFGPPRIWK